MEEYNADENCFDLAQHHKLVPSGRNARSWRLRQQQTSHHHTLAASLSSLSRFISNATFRLSIPCPVGQWDPVGCFSGLSLDYPGTLCFPSRAWRMPPSFSRMSSFQVGQVEYLGRPLLDASAWAPDWKHASAPEPPVLATCFRLQTNQTVDAGTLNAWRNHQLDHDDIFHPAFLERVIFNSVESDQVTLTDDAKQVLKDWNTTKVDFSPHLNLTSGPYYLDRGVFHSVWRVSEDPQLAFLEAIWPLEENRLSFTRVSAAGNGYPWHRDNETQSALRGMRIAVKDNYHIQGCSHRRQSSS
ncbi:hypothetical protein V2G26_012771 [Clonostachys chloroleuca]